MSEDIVSQIEAAKREMYRSRKRRRKFMNDFILLLFIAAFVNFLSTPTNSYVLSLASLLSINIFINMILLSILHAGCECVGCYLSPLFILVDLSAFELPVHLIKLTLLNRNVLVFNHKFHCLWLIHKRMKLVHRNNGTCFKRRIEMSLRRRGY